MGVDVGMVTSAAVEGEPALISAVRSADTAVVRRIVHEHVGRVDEETDSDTRNAAFALAVRMHGGDIAQLLLQFGANPAECAPEELLSLREAVESGSPALVEALLDHRIFGRYSPSELAERLELARSRHEAGVEAELRRRTGSQDAVVVTRVQDDEYYTVGEFTLGGTTVRDGHGAILTYLEELLGIRAAFEELMARALEHDQDHAVWGATTILLAGRRDQATWAAAAALRTHAAPSHRLFGARVLRLTHLFDDSDEGAFEGPALDIFTEWSTTETDVAVLTEVLVALGQHADPRSGAALLPYAGHPDPGVRGAVAGGLGTWPGPRFSEEVRKALLALMRDTDATVRREACRTVAEGPDRDPVLADALAALLDDGDREVQVVALYGLARHDDERCVEAERRLGPPDQGHSTEKYYFDAVWRYEWRRAGS